MCGGGVCVFFVPLSIFISYTSGSNPIFRTNLSWPVLSVHPHLSSQLSENPLLPWDLLIWQASSAPQQGRPDNEPHSGWLVRGYQLVQGVVTVTFFNFPGQSPPPPWLYLVEALDTPCEFFFTLITDPTHTGPYPAQPRHPITLNGNQGNGGRKHNTYKLISDSFILWLISGRALCPAPIKKLMSLHSLPEVSFLGNISHLREGE